MNDYCEKEDSEILNAGCLLYIEDVSIITIFYLFYLKIKNELHYRPTKRQIFLDLRLTPDVFARYLIISSIEGSVMAFGTSNASQTAVFPLDVILLTIINRKYSRVLNIRRNNNYAFIKEPIQGEDWKRTKNFDIDCSTVDCYRAAYLYQYRKYREVFQLCERILSEPDLREDLKEIAFANVLVLPPLDLLFHTDVQCLLGFYTLAYYLLVTYEDSEGIKLSKLSTSHKSVLRKMRSSKFSLSVVLIQPSSVGMKRYYFIGRHFLARYLKVRCLLDCNNSFSEAMVEFKKVKVSLPFEDCIRCFLQQKLRRFHKVSDSQHGSG